MAVIVGSSNSLSQCYHARMRALYTLTLLLLTPILLVRSARKYRGLHWGVRQRLGFNRPRIDRPIWIHAASVGEVRAIAPIANDLIKQGPVLITTTTPTGRDQVVQLCPDTTHAFLPYDLPWAMGAWMRALKPRCLLLVETELWPNLIHAAKVHEIPAVLVNGRLSKRSARGYARMGSLARNMMASLDGCLVQSADHATAFTRLGAHPLVIGNIKFDTQLPPSTLPSGRWIVAASTHPGEEAACLKAFAKISQTETNLKLLIVPRHPERFDDVVSEAEKHGEVGRASRNQWAPAIVVGDAMGQLSGWLNGAEVAFIGGTLNRRGSQSPIEAALGGAVIVAGPSRYNFAEAYALLASGSLVDVADEPELAGALNEALTKDGDKNAALISASRGATARTLAYLTSEILRS
ncbi:3-deoxy-D-manno-octulosonic acid transferase [Litorivicinus lipolyticus]|nr:3-deoxy-D-manno-octulosonic acid transferase [Litorivicinus lipolyticus]